MRLQALSACCRAREVRSWLSSSFSSRRRQRIRVLTPKVTPQSEGSSALEKVRQDDVVRGGRSEVKPEGAILTASERKRNLNRAREMKKGARASLPGAEIAHPLANVLFERTEKVNGLL